MSETKKIHRRRSKLDPFLDRLGLIADADIARLAGVTVQNVAAFRKRHGIELNPLPTVPAPVVTETAPEVEPETAPEPAPVPSLYPCCEMSEEDYRSAPGLNFSTLKHLVTSPHAFRYFRDVHKSEPTAAQSLGTAIHMRVLEPEKYGATYAVREKVDGRTKEGKAYNAQWEADNPGKIAIDKETAYLIEECADAVYCDKGYRNVVACNDGVELAIESPMFWNDPLFGDCKARPDILRWDGKVLTVWDLKTTSQRIDSHSIARTMGEWLIPLQLAFYARGGAAQLGLDPSDTMRVDLKVTFVQTTAPFDAVTYRIATATQYTTNDLIEELASLLADCTKRNVWRGLPSGNAIDVPPYYLTVK